MARIKRVIWFSIASAMMIGGLSFADDTRELTWDDLIPEDERLLMEQYVYGLGASIDHNADPGAGGDKSFSAPAYTPGVVKDLDGVQAKIPGFVVPLELADEGKVKEFLLVPYFGACIHYPPPPANQIVYVVLDKPVEIESPWDPVWAVGELQTKFHQSDLGSAGYTMAAQDIEEYIY